NVAYETGGTPPSCPSSQCVVTPTPGRVSISKSLTSENGSVPGMAEPGETEECPVRKDSDGGSEVTGYGVTDQLDPNTTFVSADNGGTHAGGVQTCALPILPANGSLVLTVTVTVADPIPAGVTQIANVAYETGGTPPSCPSSQCVVTPTPGRVSISKSLTSENGSVPGMAEPGASLVYTITLDNDGGSDVTGYGVTDQLDPNTTFVSADNGGTHAGGVLTWSGLTVSANGSLLLTVTLTVAHPIPAGVPQITLVPYTTRCRSPSCPSSQCVVTPTPGRVSISKSLTSENGSVPGMAEPGETLVYTITLDNDGGSDVTGYGVTDQLDPNTTFVSADNGGTHAGGVVTWSGLTVPANGSLVLTVTVTVADPIPAGVTQIANVAYETGG